MKNKNKYRRCALDAKSLKKFRFNRNEKKFRKRTFNFININRE